MDRRPTVGVFTKQLDNWTSGSGHHLNEMMKHVLEMNTRLRFIFIHYSPSENPIYEKADGELIIPRNPLRAAALLRRHHFDVLHFTPLTFFAPIWGTPGKKMATIHGIEQLLVPQFYGPVEMAHERLLVPLYARRMDHIITVSRASKDYFVEHFHVRPERITVCPNGMNETYRVLSESERGVQAFPTGVESLLFGRWLQPGDRYIFHISRFSERKNPWTILRGFAEFIRRPVGRDMKLVIAGGKWDNAEVADELQRLGIENKVILTGFVGEEEAVRLYNGAEAFIFPSLAEGFGMPNIEAMACGCPVITSGIFAIPEVVGDAALLMKDPKDAQDLADKLEILTSNEDLKEDLIARGLERAKRYRSWEPSAKKLLEVYEELGEESSISR
jgi:glycosyltransferase involved in cell wall biosynthesis